VKLGDRATNRKKEKIIRGDFGGERDSEEHTTRGE